MGNPAVITVFGSSAVREGEPAYAQALELGAAIARAGWVLCNGGYGGTMEATARGAKSEGGTTIGVTCRLFRSQPNPYLDEQIVAANLSERIDMLVSRADGFVVLPGGTGTLAELAVTLEMVSKGFGRARPVVLLGPYWYPVVELADRERGRLRPLVHLAHSPHQAVEHLRKALASRQQP